MRLQRAKELAYRAHAGQVDMAGRPYIAHVARVAAQVADDPEAEAVAWHCMTAWKMLRGRGRNPLQLPDYDFSGGGCDNSMALALGGRVLRAR